MQERETVDLKRKNKHLCCIPIIFLYVHKTKKPWYQLNTTALSFTISKCILLNSKT